VDSTGYVHRTSEGASVEEKHKAINTKENKISNMGSAITLQKKNSRKPQSGLDLRLVIGHGL